MLALHGQDGSVQKHMITRCAVGALCTFAWGGPTFLRGNSLCGHACRDLVVAEADDEVCSAPLPCDCLAASRLACFGYLRAMAAWQAFVDMKELAEAKKRNQRPRLVQGRKGFRLARGSLAKVCMRERELHDEVGFPSRLLCLRVCKDAP